MFMAAVTFGGSQGLRGAVLTPPVTNPLPVLTLPPATADPTPRSSFLSYISL